MVKKSFYILLVFILFCCSDNKYVMGNMENGDYIDVSSYIDEGYKPIYASDIDKTISMLIKPNAKILNDKIFVELEKELGLYFNKKISIVEGDILYKYSYIISEDLVDVYVVKLTINHKSRNVYFRIDDDNLILPLNEEGWVISSDHEQ